MGYVQEKYTRGYFLNQDENGNRLDVGVAGLEEFQSGGIRNTDRLVLEKVRYSGKRVLDIGFGRGEAIKFAHDRGAEDVVGVDFSRDSLDIAKDMLEREGIIADLYCDDASNFVKEYSKKGSKFDIVIMLDFIEHVPRAELREMLKDLHGLLNEDAVLCVNTPVFKVDNDVLVEGLKEAARDMSDENEATQGMHCNRYTKESLRTFMDEVGYHAISGHFFANSFSSNDGENDEKTVWEQAKASGLPLIGEWTEDYYEYALTSEEIAMNAQKELNSELFRNDYNLEVLKRVGFQGFSMDVTERYSHHYIDNEYEKFSADLFANSIKEHSRVIDIGGHYGFYSLIAASRAPKGHVYTFEPVRENFELLSKNMALNGFTNVTVENAAVSDRSGEMEFNVTEASDSSGFYQHPLTRTKEIRKVKTISPDGYLRGTEIDVVKIDTEGHELVVLDGMSEIIEHNGNIRLFIEFNPKCLLSAKTDPAALLEKIHAMGFDIFFINDEKRRLHRVGDDVSVWKELMGEKEYANIMCVKRGSIPYVCLFAHSSMRGGAELSMLELVRSMSLNGEAFCHVVFPSEGEICAEYDRLPVSTGIVPFGWWAVGEGSDIDRNSILSKISESVEKSVAEVSIIDPDIVYTCSGVIPQGAIAAKMLNKTHVWHVHEFGEKDHGFTFLLDGKERFKFIIDSSDKVIFNSYAVRDHFNGLVSGKIDETKEVVVYNHVELKNDTSNDDETYFTETADVKLLVLGEIKEGKGQMDAILAVKKLSEDGVFAELRIVGRIGSEEYHDKLRGIIETNDLDKSVRFVDFVENPTKLIKDSDVLLMCSRSEAFGRVTVEAMLCKKPVIGANGGGTTELIRDGENGFLYEVGNSDDLAEKIKALSSDKERAARLGENGYEFATKTFSDKNYSGKILEVMTELEIGSDDVSDHFYENIVSRVMNGIPEKERMMTNFRSEIDRTKRELTMAELELQNMRREVSFMHASKFWAVRSIYIKYREKFRFAVCSPGKLLKKYLVILFG